MSARKDSQFPPCAKPGYLDLFSFVGKASPLKWHIANDKAVIMAEVCEANVLKNAHAQLPTLYPSHCLTVIL